MDFLPKCRKNLSCEYSKRVEGKKIKFPTESVFTQYMCDTMKYDTDSDFKLMIYVDSTGCTSCKLQLHKWKSFLNEMDSVTNDKIALLFYVCPKDKREFEHILKRDKFDYQYVLMNTILLTL